MKMMLIIIVALLLSSCAKLEMKGFDPATSTLQWIIQNERK